MRHNTVVRRKPSEFDGQQYFAERAVAASAITPLRRRAGMRIGQVAALIAIPALVATPFALRVTERDQGAAFAMRATESQDAELDEPGSVAWTMPSFGELYSAFESLEAARLDVLRWAHEAQDAELNAAAERYREAADAWRGKFTKVRERLTPEHARSLRHELCSTREQSEAVAVELHPWETGGLESGNE